MQPAFAKTTITFNLKFSATQSTAQAWVRACPRRTEQQRGRWPSASLPTEGCPSRPVPVAAVGRKQALPRCPPAMLHSSLGQQPPPPLPVLLLQFLCRLREPVSAGGWRTTWATLSASGLLPRNTQPRLCLPSRAVGARPPGPGTTACRSSSRPPPHRRSDTHGPPSGPLSSCGLLPPLARLLVKDRLEDRSVARSRAPRGAAARTRAWPGSPVLRSSRRPPPSRPAPSPRGSPPRRLTGCERAIVVPSQQPAVAREQQQQRRAPPLKPRRWSVAAAATVPRGEPAVPAQGVQLGLQRRAAPSCAPASPAVPTPPSLEPCRSASALPTAAAPRAARGRPAPRAWCSLAPCRWPSVPSAPAHGPQMGVWAYVRSLLRLNRPAPTAELSSSAAHGGRRVLGLLRAMLLGL